MPNWKKLITSGSSASLTSLTLTSLPGQGSEATSVMINAGGTLGTSELGSLAFSSATYDNYSSWNLKTDSTQRTTVSSGGTLDIIGGTLHQVKIREKKLPSPIKFSSNILPFNN